MAPEWISHRGWHHGFCENTLPAFEEAERRGFEFFELDLRLSADGHIVCCHDASYARVGGPKAGVEQLTRTQLEHIDLGDGASPMFLDTFLERFPTKRYAFDIKPDSAPAVIAALAQREDIRALTNRTVFLFWTQRHERLARQYLGGITCFAQSFPCKRASAAHVFHVPMLSGVVPGSIYSVPPVYGPLRLYRSDVIDGLRQQGALLLAYLPETAEHVQRAMDLGFDYVLTNHGIGPAGIQHDPAAR